MVKKEDYIDILKLTWKQEKDLIARVEEMEAARVTPNEVDRRASKRRLYVVKGGVLLTLNNVNGGGRAFRAIPRDLSEGGIGLLHSSYLYDDTPVTVTFLLDDGERLDVSGRVRRCAHVEGKVHIVGVMFDSPLSANAFFEVEDEIPDSVEAEDSDAGEKEFAGKVLYVEEDPMHQRMVGQLFERMGVEVDIVEDWKQAISLLTGAKFNALLMPLPVEGETGASVVRALRGRGIVLPIVALSIGGIDDSEASIEAALEMGCTEVLGKPLTFMKVKMAVNRLLKKKAA